MGMIGALLGFGQASREIGAAAQGISEVFTVNATKQMVARERRHGAALEQAASEFGRAETGFDRFINGINRMPRPLLAFVTFGLFAFAMVDPVSFAGRMTGLNDVPDPLWWLMGAIVSFYFGARELHYKRGSGVNLPVPQIAVTQSDNSSPSSNAALDEWRQQSRKN
jgi:hypothetical protein